jgi:hypothetical protein
MTRQLFDGLPIVSSDVELESIKYKYPDLDQYYIASGCIAERRKRFKRLWATFAPYADPHFLVEIKKHFHQRTWEMYVGNILLDKSFCIESNSNGPDFVINQYSEDNLYIECIAPNCGIGNDAVPQAITMPIAQSNELYPVPQDEIIQRITAALKQKIEQYHGWTAKKWFNPSLPYVLAINTAGLGYIGDPQMPYVLKAFFGVDCAYIGIGNNLHGWHLRSSIERSSGSLVNVNSFLSSEAGVVSGILFSDFFVVNHPSILGDDCLFVNNPYAINPVNNLFTNHFKGWISTANKDSSVSLLKR